MSIYSVEIATYLNSSQNPNIKLTRLINIVDNFYNNLLSGNSRIISFDETFNDLIDELDTLPLPFYNRLTQNILINNIPNTVGFNKTKIAYAIPGKPDTLLDSLDNELKIYWNNVKNIYKYSNRNINDFNGLLSTLNTNINFDEPINKYILNDSSFKYIYGQTTYNNINATSFNGVCQVLGYMQLSKLMTYCWDFNAQFFKQIANYQLHPISEIDNSFSNFINSDSTSLSIILEDYLLHNVFVLDAESSLFGTSISNKINNLLPDLKILFSDYINQLDYKSYIRSNSTLISSSLLNFLSLDLFYNIYPDNYIETMSFDFEEEILNRDYGKFLYSNQDKLDELQYIAFQYNLSPLFFINSIIWLYQQWIKNTLTGEQVSELFPDKIKLTTDGLSVQGINVNYPSHLQYSDTTSLYQTLESLPFQINNSKAVEYALKIKLRIILINFINTPQFNTWLLDQFIPKILETINETYLYSPNNIYSDIDNITTFFKTLLLKNLLNDNLFSDYISDYNSTINAIANTNINFMISQSFLDDYMNSSNFVTMVDKESNNVQLLMKNLFLTSEIIKYVILLLNKYSL